MPTSATKEVRIIKKEKYERTALEVIEFRTEDILTRSNPDDEYELERGMIRFPNINL